MGAERLFVKASARGVDLQELAAQSTNFYGAGSPRRRTLIERAAGIPAVRETVTGKQSRVARAPYYSHAELGMSLAGLDRLPYMAAMHSFALDPGIRTELYLGLREVAARIARAEKWAITVSGLSGREQHYQDELAELILDADWYKPLFQLHEARRAESKDLPSLYAIYMDVSEEVWQSHLMGHYLTLQTRYERWLAIARAFVNKRLMEEFDDRSATIALAKTG